MKLFIVNTTHTDYDEYDPFLVLADSETLAKELVSKSEGFQENRMTRRRKSGLEPWGDGQVKGYMSTEDCRSEVTSIEEISQGEGKIVWAIFNPG